jgi:hypothetical protein
VYRKQLRTIPRVTWNLLSQTGPLAACRTVVLVVVHNLYRGQVFHNIKAGLNIS